MPFKVAAVSSHIKSKWSLSTLAKSIGQAYFIIVSSNTASDLFNTSARFGLGLILVCLLCSFFLVLLTSKLKMNKLCLESESSGPFFRFSDNNQLLVYLGNWRLHLKFIAQNCHGMIKWPMKLLTAGMRRSENWRSAWDEMRALAIAKLTLTELWSRLTDQNMIWHHFKRVVFLPEKNKNMLRMCLYNGA